MPAPPLGATAKAEPGTAWVWSRFSDQVMVTVMPSAATENNYYWDIGYILGVRDYGTSTTPAVAGEHIGWNYAYDPKKQAWRLYTDDGLTTGKPQYAYADLKELFEVSW